MMSIPIPFIVLGVLAFYRRYSALLTFWDTTNTNYLYFGLWHPVLTAQFLSLSSLWPFALFFSFGFLLEDVLPEALALDLDTFLGRSYFLCIYSSHHTFSCHKNFYAVVSPFRPATSLFKVTHRS